MNFRTTAWVILAAASAGCKAPLQDGIGPGDFLGVSRSSRGGWGTALDSPTRNATALSLLAAAAAVQINGADEHYQEVIAAHGYGPGNDPKAVSDVGSDALLVGALIAPLLFAPHPELGVSKQNYAATAAYAFAANLVVNQATKALSRRTRPNGANDASFYSGHTSNSFAGAQLLYRMYGWKAGVPAFAAASLVAYSRVEASQHFPADVLVGAAAGIWLTDLIYEKNHGKAGLFTTAHQVRVAPVVRPGMLGVSLGWSR